MIKVDNIYKKFKLEAGLFSRYGKFVYAVNGVSFEIRELETYGLVGESGCGKTTTARLLVRLYDTDEGKIHFTDQKGRIYPIHEVGNKDLSTIRSRIKYIFQDPARSLNPKMTILEILTGGLKYSGSWTNKKEALDRAANILQAVGLKTDDLTRRPQDFSGGQRQRISIARALMVNPELLICDEVVSALDVSIQSQILNLLVDIKKERNLSILFIAHDLTVVTYFCDRVGVMYGGMIVEEAVSKALTENPLHPYTQLLYSSIPEMDKSLSISQTEIRDLPDLTIKPSGCLFFSRCPVRIKGICEMQKPELIEIEPGHKAACHRVTLNQKSV